FRTASTRHPYILLLLAHVEPTEPCREFGHADRSGVHQEYAFYRELGSSVTTGHIFDRRRGFAAHDRTSRNISSNSVTAARPFSRRATPVVLRTTSSTPTSRYSSICLAIAAGLPKRKTSFSIIESRLTSASSSPTVTAARRSMSW